MWMLYGLCRERERVINWDRPLVKVGESLRLCPVGMGWDRWERVSRKLWWEWWKGGWEEGGGLGLGWRRGSESHLNSNGNQRKTFQLTLTLYELWTFIF